MRVVIRLTKYAFRHKWYLFGAYATMVASTLSAMVIPRILGDAIDEALASGLQSRLLVLAATIVLVSLLRGVFSFGQRYLSESLSQRSAYDLREEFFRKLQGMSFGFFDKEQTGNLMSKATQDVEAVRMFISMGMVRGLSIFVMLGAVSVLMALTNWRLAIVSMAFVPFILWRALAMSNVLRPTWMKVQQETGEMTTVLQENLSGMKVVKAFGAQSFEESKFNARANAVANLTYSATRVFASQGSLMTFIFTAAIGAILWFGGREVAAERLTAGGLASFILYMGLLGMPIRMSGWMVNTFSRASSAGATPIRRVRRPVAGYGEAGRLPLAQSGRTRRLRERRGQLRRSQERGPKHRFRSPTWKSSGPPGRPRLRQEHNRPRHSQVLRRLRGPYRHRRLRRQGRHPLFTQAERRNSHAGRVRLRRQHKGQHSLRPRPRGHGARRQGGQDRPAS